MINSNIIEIVIIKMKVNQFKWSLYPHKLLSTWWLESLAVRWNAWYVCINMTVCNHVNGIVYLIKPETRLCTHAIQPLQHTSTQLFNTANFSFNWTLQCPHKTCMTVGMLVPVMKKPRHSLALKTVWIYFKTRAVYMVQYTFLKKIIQNHYHCQENDPIFKPYQYQYFQIWMSAFFLV